MEKSRGRGRGRGRGGEGRKVWGGAPSRTRRSLSTRTGTCSACATRPLSPLPPHSQFRAPLLTRACSCSPDTPRRRVPIFGCRKVPSPSDSLREGQGSAGEAPEATPQHALFPKKQEPNRIKPNKQKVELARALSMFAGVKNKDVVDIASSGILDVLRICAYNASSDADAILVRSCLPTAAFCPCRAPAFSPPTSHHFCAPPVNPQYHG